MPNECGYTWEVVQELEDPCPYYDNEHVCCNNMDHDGEHDCTCGASQTEDF